MNEYSPFHNPADFGTFDLSTTQVGKRFIFEWSEDVIPEAKIVAVLNGRVIKTYTVGEGLVISDADRKVVLTVNGQDYETYTNKRVSLFCNFFVLGDVEVAVSLRIVKSYL